MILNFSSIAVIGIICVKYNFAISNFLHTLHSSNYRCILCFHLFTSPSAYDLYTFPWYFLWVFYCRKILNKCSDGRTAILGSTLMEIGNAFSVSWRRILRNFLVIKSLTSLGSLMLCDPSPSFSITKGLLQALLYLKGAPIKPFCKLKWCKGKKQLLLTYMGKILSVPRPEANHLRLSSTTGPVLLKNARSVKAVPRQNWRTLIVFLRKAKILLRFLSEKKLERRSLWELSGLISSLLWMARQPVCSDAPWLVFHGLCFLPTRLA